MIGPEKQLLFGHLLYFNINITVLAYIDHPFTFPLCVALTSRFTQ